MGAVVNYGELYSYFLDLLLAANLSYAEASRIAREEVEWRKAGELLAA